ncbi:MAG TPA: hypothetical protein VER55_01390 [Ardenticatenaceae bacterium]|nr:hypothetical protein [Ardenticatenaceae bacterium]
MLVCVGCRLGVAVRAGVRLGLAGRVEVAAGVAEPASRVRVADDEGLAVTARARPAEVAAGSLVTRSSREPPG